MEQGQRSSFPHETDQVGGKDEIRRLRNEEINGGKLPWQGSDPDRGEQGRSPTRQVEEETSQVPEGDSISIPNKSNGRSSLSRPN